MWCAAVLAVAQDKPAPDKAIPDKPGESKPAAEPQFKTLLDPDEIQKALDDNRVFRLDVRDPKELSDLGTVTGYVNIPLKELEARLSEVPKDKLILPL
jgi:hypothetical protein